MKFLLEITGLNRELYEEELQEIANDIEGGFYLLSAEIVKVKLTKLEDK